MTLNARLQAYRRANARLHAEVIELPGFTVYVGPRAEGPEASFAMPESPAAATRGSLAQVAAALAERERAGAISSVEGYAPGLAATLAEAGYREHSRKPIMVYEGAPVRPPTGPAGLEIEMLDATAPLQALRENLTINIQGFESAEPLPNDDDALAFGRLLSRARAFTACLRGAAVAAAMMEAPVEGVSELVGVTTLPAHRRQGIASALVARMAQQARALGVEVVFLRPVSDESARIYARAGFAHHADLLTWVREG